MASPRRKVSLNKSGGAAAALLAWYDENARILPWRVGPKERAKGARPDPYVVWLSEVMLQQTTVATVAPRFSEFLCRWPNVEALAAAELDEVLGAWAGLGYYARARNLHKCAVEVARLGGFPQAEEGLRALPGVGDYTAAAIAAIAYDARAIPVDGNIERVTARLFAIETPLPSARAEIKARIGEIWPETRSGDFAQALMDLGASACAPRSPDCGACPLSVFCAAFMRGEPDAFPRRAAKQQKPTRFGAAYALFNGDGAVLLERRPEKGLLGGMLGLPGTEWSAEKPAASPPAKAKWKEAGSVRHNFTHFHLELDVFAARAPKSFREPAGWLWLPAAEARLPTVMKKALERASDLIS